MKTCALEQETLTVKCDHRGNRTFATTLSGLHTSASQSIQAAQLLGEVGKAQSECGVTPCEEAVHHDCTRMKGQNATQWGGGQQISALSSENIEEIKFSERPMRRECGEGGRTKFKQTKVYRLGMGGDSV